jgi:6-phosphogluconolactonase
MTACADLEVYPTADALMSAAAESFVQAAKDAVRESGRFAVALSGGATPKQLYRLLAAEPYALQVDWSRVHIFWGDERCVPPDDPASNFHMVREALLDRVPLPAGNVHRIRGEGDPARNAEAYEAELRSFFQIAVGVPPPRRSARLDLVWLGLGENGHTASLFPGLTAVRETTRWVVANYVAEVSMWRVTLTPVAINSAAEVVFLVSGAEKSAMLRRVFAEESHPDLLPAQAVAPAAGRLRWLVDAPAAADLQRVQGRLDHIPDVP